MAPLSSSEIIVAPAEYSTPSAASERVARKRSRALALASAAALVCFLAYWIAGATALVWSSTRILHSQVENTYPESSQVYVAVQTARTGRLYFPLSDPAHALQPFGPLSYVVDAMIAKASHLDYDLLTFRARELAFACYLLCGVMAYLIARRLRFPRTSAAAAGLMLLAEKLFANWNATVRPDMLFLLAMLVSLFFALRAGDDNRKYALSGMLGGVAFLIKQPGIGVIIAIGAVLLGRTKYKAAAWLALGAALPTVVTFAALLLRHEPFAAQFALAGQTVRSIAGAIDFTGGHLGDLDGILAVAIGAIGFAIAIRGDESEQMIASFAAVNWCLGLAGLAQLGADVNYFLPGVAGCALLLPFILREMRERMRSPIVFAGAAVAFLTLLPGQLAIAQTALFDDAPAPAVSYAELAPFHILSDRPRFVLRGRDPDLLDPFTAHALELTGHWDSAPIVAEIRRGDYDLIILACSASRYVCVWRGIGYFGPATVEAMNQNYQVFCGTMSSTVLVPRARSVTVTPEMLAPAFGVPCGTARHGAAPMILFPEGVR